MIETTFNQYDIIKKDILKSVILMLIHILSKPLTSPPISNILLTLTSNFLIFNGLTKPILFLLTFTFRPYMFCLGH